MTQTKPSIVSQQYASSLLAAWNTGDLAGLDNALDRTANADKTGLRPCEWERVELVQGIAETIDAWQRETRWVGPADLDVSLRLLGNLARHQVTREGWPAMPPTFGPREVYQSERLVFAQR